MEIVDLLLKRFDGESELRKPASALVSFSHLETGKKLARLTYQIAMARTERSSLTLLYFLDQRQELLPQDEISVTQSKIGSDFIPKTEKGKSPSAHLSAIRRITPQRSCGWLQSRDATWYSGESAVRSYISGK